PLSSCRSARSRETCGPPWHGQQADGQRHTGPHFVVAHHLVAAPTGENDVAGVQGTADALLAMAVADYGKRGPPGAPIAPQVVVVRRCWSGHRQKKTRRPCGQRV